MRAGRGYGPIEGQLPASKAPAFNPTNWADQRKLKIEKAERLRAEQRARLQALGQLPEEPSGATQEERRQEATHLSAAPPQRAVGAIGAAAAGARRGTAPSSISPPWATEDDAAVSSPQRRPCSKRVGDSPEAAAGSPTSSVARLAAQSSPVARGSPSFIRDEEPPLGGALQWLGEDDATMLGPPPRRPPPQKPRASPERAEQELPPAESQQASPAATSRAQVLAQETRPEGLRSLHLIEELSSQRQAEEELPSFSHRVLPGEDAGLQGLGSGSPPCPASSDGARGGHTAADLAELFQQAVSVGACTPDEKRPASGHVGVMLEEATLLQPVPNEMTIAPAAPQQELALEFSEVCGIGSPVISAGRTAVASSTTTTNQAPSTAALTAMFDAAYANPSGETGNSLFSAGSPGRPLGAGTDRSLKSAEATLAPLAAPAAAPVVIPSRRPPLAPTPEVVAPCVAENTIDPRQARGDLFKCADSPADQVRAMEQLHGGSGLPSVAEDEELKRSQEAPLAGIVACASPSRAAAPPAPVQPEADHPELHDSSPSDEPGDFKVELGASLGGETCWRGHGSGDTSARSGADGALQGAWWADGPEPAWMRHLKPLRQVPPPSQEAEESSAHTAVPNSASAPRSEAASHSSFQEDASPSANATMWPQRPVEAADVKVPNWAGELKDLQSSKGLAAAPEPAAAPAPGVQEHEDSAAVSREEFSAGGDAAEAKEDEAAGWMLNLRGSPQDDFATDDPMVFGKPRPKPKPKKRSKSKGRISPSPSPDEALRPASQGDAPEDFRSGLRSYLGEEQSDEPLVYGKTRSQPLQPRRAVKRPPRPEGELAEPSMGASASGSGSSFRSRAGSGCAAAGYSSGGGSSSRPRSGGASRPRSGGSNGRPSSGYFSKNAPGAAQQMPEALRKRLEARAESTKRQQEQQRALARHNSRGQRGSSDLAAAESPHSPFEEDASSFLLDAGDLSEGPAVRLPPLDCGGRGRRASSQPPVDIPSGAQDRQDRAKKKARPRSQPHASTDDKDECSRQMFDKNTLRTNHRSLFLSAIRQFRQERCGPQADLGDRMACREGSTAASQMLSIYLRKRPMFEKEEQQRGDYDVLSILPGSPAPTQAAIHNCLFQADLKTPFVQHLTFDFDCVFDERVENAEVYDQAASRLVERCCEGGVGTMFMFGQTGSGKTHTMTSIQEHAAHDLFAGADGGEPWLSVQFVELRGNRCFDLLAPGVGSGRKDARPELRLREQPDGSYSAEGAVDLFPTSPEELCTVMQMAQSRRATSATDANAVSSRSHAVCTLRLLQSEGQLMLVDCAGTERKKDSMYHSKERQQEGAEINASLHALKECIRHLTTQQRVPGHAYRQSSLTKVLADAFARGPKACLAVICTASPCATDTEHTISTMRMGVQLGNKGQEKEEKQNLSDFLRAQRPRLVHPKQWTPDQVFEWLNALNGGLFQDAADALPSGCTGQMLVRLTENRCVQLCNSNERKGRRLFDLLHQEIQRVEASRRGN